MSTGADRARSRRLLTMASTLALLPLFGGAIYLAAKTGIELADKQVPPGSLEVADRFEAGTRWRIKAGGLAIAVEVEILRQYDFRRAGSGVGETEGVELLGTEAAGWQLQILPMGDRRYVKVKFLSGTRQGDEVWVILEQLEAFSESADGG